MHHRRIRQIAFGLCTAFTVILLIEPALASSSGGGGMPWEGPLQQIQQSITGPVAGAIALVAVAIAGGMLIFGGELGTFAQRLIYVVLVAGLLLGATQVVALFNSSGASIDEAPGWIGTAHILLAAALLLGAAPVIALIKSRVVGKTKQSMSPVQTVPHA